MKNSSEKKSEKRKQFLLRLLAIVMVISMMPYQALATAHAAPTDAAVATEESVDQTGDDQNNVVLEEPAEEMDQEEAVVEEDANKDTDESSSMKTEVMEDVPPAKASKEGAKAGDEGNEGEGQGQGETLSPKEQADIYYGEGGGGGTAKTYTVALTETGHHTTALAGEQITYNVNISMQAAATYKYDDWNQEPMFTKWEHITIELELPEQQTITGVIGNNVQSFAYDQARGVWVITLKSDHRDATNSNSITFDINTRIDVNGALADGTVLSLSDDDTIGARIKVSTDFDLVVDEYGHTGSQQDPPIPRYEFTEISTTNPITLTTPDEWTMTKSPYEHGYDIDKDTGKVTIHYLIKYGLKVEDVLSDDPNVYTALGRAPFDHDLVLTDTPTLTLAGGGTLDAESVTVTPAHTGYQYKDGTSADEGGNPKPITVTNDKATLPYAVVGTNTKYVAENTPAYSEYNVDLVYNLDDFMVWYYENLPSNDALSKNTANIEYQILGQSDKHYPEDDGEVVVPSYIGPGKIKIEKNIVNYNNNVGKPYDNKIKPPVTGPATYEVFEKDGTTPAKIYYRNSQGKYERIKDENNQPTNVITIDPSKAASAGNGTDGTISFFIDAGEYVVKETGAPANTQIVGNASKTVTPTELEDVTAEGVKATFNNKEQLREIKIHKKDDTGNENPVKGAVFGLYEDENHTIEVTDETGRHITVTTDNSGNATFTRLIPGVYYVWEISAPTGYVKYDESIRFDVTDASTAQAYDVINHKDGKIIYLQKKYSTVADPNNFIDVTADYAAFENAFVLQKSTDGGSTWTNVATLSIDDLGGASYGVKEYDGDTKIQYRFVETIPAGYYSEGGLPGDGTNTQISSVVTPADCETQDDLTITMKNRRDGIIELTKKKVTVNSNSGVYTAANQSDKTFKLYRIPEGSTAAEYVDGTEKTTDSDGKIKYTGLPAVNASGKIYTYYVVEQNTDSGYTWVTDSTIKINGQDTAALKIGTFTASSGGTLESTTYNIQQDIVIGIVKKDKLTGTQLANAKFKVSDGTNEWNITSLGSGKATLQIKLGKNYTITETDVPAGYNLDAEAQSINTTGWTVKRKANGDYAIFKADGTTEVSASDLTFTFEDTPQKKIRVTKKVKGKNQEDSQATNLSGVTFSIYVKENGSFVPYKVNGQAVTIRANGSDTVSLPSEPNSDYYLHEDNAPNTVVNPDQHPEEYTGKGEYANGKFYFGPYHSTKPTESGDILWPVSIINISNTGDLIVKKRTYNEYNQEITGDASAVNGFAMQVFKADADGNPTGSAIRTVTTSGSGANAGQAKFTGLPIYDANGIAIRYVVVETYNTDQSKVFYTDSFKSDGSPVNMILGDTADAGYVENHKYMTVNVTKKYYDAREHELTGLEYALEGAKIALYKNNGDGTYTYVDMGTTNSKGKLAFGDLKYAEHGYVAIEVSVPDRPEYKYMVPKEGDYLELDAQGHCPESLTEEQVAALSKVPLTAYTDPKYTGTIYNVIPWTQIHVTKWSDDATPVKLDGADFILYKQVLDENTPTNIELTFDANNCTVVGEYTSGTWIHNDQAQTGEFQTDVLDNADNIVYWLVEVRPPAGFSIIDSENYVLFSREGTNYTNNSNDGKSTMVYTYNDEGAEIGLKDNTINYHNVYNHREQGPGDGTENRAYIEFTKWMQKESTAEKPKDQLVRTDFTLMPNATFELYAVNKNDHNKVYLLDTITTGDENLVEGQNNTTGYGVSRALDAWEIFDYIEANFPDQLNDIITYQSTDDPAVTYPYVLGDDGKPELDANGNRKRIPGTFWLNAVLIEKSGSSAYELDLHDHNLQITFVTSTLGLGNDKYCVVNIEDTSADFCDANETRRLDYTDNRSRSMAIVDYLSVNNSVVLRHFGYDPETVGYHLFHADLETKYENNPAAFLSKQVTFALEKYNAATKVWEPWSPTDNAKTTAGQTNTFTTDGNGYHFDSGLDPGDYRVVMTTPAAGYENFYPNNNLAFRFTVVVTDRTQMFTTYSPSRPDVSIEKVDIDGNTLTDAAKFRLRSRSGTSYDRTVTTSNGKAVFKELPADAKFTLTETQAPTGYSNAYFAQLFKAKYPSYAALVEGSTGYLLGYETKTENGEKVIVDKDYSNNFAFEAPNVEDVKLKLIKKDAQDSSVFLNGAQFRIYYMAFNVVSGNYTVPEFKASEWQNLGLVTTRGDGTVIVDDNSFAGVTIKPGVYYAVEVTAPEHYQLNTKGQRIVMTGGLDLTIAEHPDQYTICDTAGGTGELVFEDIPLEGITVKKVVEFGDLPARNYNFTFSLLNAEGQSMTGDPATATGPSPETNAVFADLTQGASYYLKEGAKTGYKLDTVKIGNNTINPESSGDFEGYYKITMPTDGSGVTVTVTNILLEAQVTIFKYDGENGEGLTGAEFEVLDADEHVVSNAEVTDNGDGSYTAVIPLTTTNGADFYIHETKAPEKDGKKYTIDDNNDKILVEDLKPGQKRTFTYYAPSAANNQYCLPNFEGIDVKIHKYGGLPDAANKVDLAGAKFQMYFSTNNGQTWNTWHPAETTDEHGEATFRIIKKYTYAIAEINDVAGYVGLYGVYDGNTKLGTTTSSDNRTLYILGNSFETGQTYEYAGYNIPYLKLIVEKEDWDKENDGPNAVEHPDTQFHVYEVPNGTPETLTEKQIQDLIADNQDYINGETEDSTYTNTQFICPGKTYLAVEDHALDRDSTKDDYSIIKDDTRVVSYQVFSVPLVNYEDEYTVTFVNVKGDATIGLEKTVDPANVESLTKYNADLTYTLKPSTTNGYALDSFKLNDSGLTTKPTDATLADEWYNITEVIVGQGSMDKYLKGAKKDKDYDIFATVTFVDFDGNEYPQNAVNVSGGNISVIPTGDAAGKNIKSFYVTYSSPDLLTDTGYALGQNFEAGETIVKATVFKQETPESGVLTAVKEIRNDADVVLYYSPWTPEGEKEASTDLRAKDHAVTTVDDAKAPRIHFQKDGPDTNTAIDLNSEITYTLTIENVTETDIDFEDPIIVDLLPQGISLATSSDFVRVVSKPDTINDNPTITTGFAGDSQFVDIAFKGTVGKGESIVVELTGIVTPAVTNYGSTMINYAFTTSKEVGVITSENQTGAVIKDTDGAWALELVKLAKRLGCDEERAQALKEALGTEPGQQGTFGYLGDYHQNYWISETDLICVKAEYGPADGEIYRTDKVSILVNDEQDVSQRTMHYQLTINNISTSKRTNLAVMDIMPTVGDQRINNVPRQSSWPLYFDDIKSVKVNGEKCDASQYKVYYYTGDATQFHADDIADTVNIAKERCPDGWSETKPSGNITAIIVAFAYDPDEEAVSTTASTVILDARETAQIEYTATTPYREAEELNEIVFTNAANDFNFGFSTFAPPNKSNQALPFDPLGSNVVEVTIAPPYVKVGGDIWIDADSDGWQNDGAQSWYLNYDIVKQLIGDAANNVSGDLGIKLNTSNNQNYSIVTDVTQGTINRTGSDPNNYGVGHFEFDYLTAAKVRSEYAGQTDILKTWNSDGDAKKLVGKNPFTYNMSLSDSGTVFEKTINKVDPRGSYVPGSIPDNDQKDDNFEKTRAVDYHSEQFFLHQTSELFDMTKDAGFNVPKKLELTKVSESDGEPIEGAEFKLYGPFDHDTGATQTLSNDNLIDTLTTGSDGKVSKDGLFFFKEYVIVETKSGTGHSIDGAVAQGNIEKLDEGKWLLHVPAFNAVPSEDEVYTETVNVSNPGNIKVSVEKKWNDNDDEYDTRPDSIKVMLYTDEDCTVEAKDADGNVVESKTLNEQNHWKEEWTNLPRYKNSTAITYYVKETDSSGHELDVYDAVIKRDTETGSGNQTLTITNTPKTKGLKVEKTWDDNEELSELVSSATFRIERSTDGTTWTPVTKKGTVVTLTIDRNSSGTATYDGLPTHDADNKPITYRAVEISITINGQTLEVKDGKVGPYEVTGTDSPGTLTDLSKIKNTMIPTEFEVEKTFVSDIFDLNKEIKSIKVMMQRRTAEGEWADREEYDLTPGEDWKHTWEGLAKFDWSGTPYEYRAIEVSYTTKDGKTIPVVYDSEDKTSGSIGAYAYSSLTQGSDEDGYATLIENELYTGSLVVSKVWEGSDGSKVPESVTILLKAIANGQHIDLKGVAKSTVLNEANGWADSTTWSQLPVYYVDGSRIGYLLTETGKGKYETRYEIHIDGETVDEGEGKILTVNVEDIDIVEATFINTLPPPYKTGDRTPLIPILLLAQLSLAGLLFLLYRRRRTA